jgi:hypothetical protein
MAGTEASMPLFYFNVDGGTYHWTDVVGKRCRDMAAARTEARRIAAEMVSSCLLAGRSPDDAIIEVEDQNLRPVLEMRLRHAAS